MGLTDQVRHQSVAHSFVTQLVINSNTLDDIAFQSAACQQFVVAYFIYTNIVVNVVKAQTVVCQKALHPLAVSFQRQGQLAYLVFCIHGWSQ